LGKSPLFGTHVSIAGSLEESFDRAAEIGCTTFQIFTRNPRVWKFKPLSDEAIEAFLLRRKSTDFELLVDHMPYLPNLAASAKAILLPSRETLKAELARCDTLRIEYMVAHIGSHGGKGTMAGIRNAAGACRAALEGSDGRAVIALENMAGQKNCVGARFEELRQILDLVDDKKRVGVCIDTCHLFAAGFDIRTQSGVESAMDLFTSVVGMQALKVVHLNDSKGPLGGSLDRHEHIGMGQIGKEGFKAFLRYKGIKDRPMILENPVDDVRGQKEDVAALRRLLPR